MNAVSARQIAHALDALFAALTDDIGGAELLGQGDTIRVAAHDDNLLGAEPFGSDDAAQPDSSIPDDGDFASATDSSRDGGMVAGAHYIREGQQARYQRAVLAHRQHIEG